MARVKVTGMELFLRTAFSLCVMFGLLGGLLASDATAAITRLDTMPATPQINIMAAGTNSANFNFTLGAGTDRYLTVALGCTDGGTAARVFTVTYGGTTVQRIVGVDSAAGQSQRRSSWIGGLAMGDSASSSTASLAVSVTPTGTCDTWFVWAGSFAGVDQTTPAIATTFQAYDNNVNNNATWSINAPAGGAGIFAAGANQRVTAVAETGQTWNWATSGTSGTAAGAQGTCLYAAAEASNPTVTFAATSRDAVSAAVLNPAAVGNTTTIADGTNPGNTTLAPGAAATNLDAFTLQTSAGTDTVTAATVTLAPANVFNNVGLVEITNNAGTVVYGSVANPSSNTVNFTGMTLPVTTTLTNFYVRITPKTHAAMPAVPGASYATTGTVTAYTCTNIKAGTDTASATLTLDNASPAVPTAAATPFVAGNAQVTVNWVNPGADFSQVVVLRRAGAAVAAVPVEGATYAVNDILGSSTVEYVGALQTFTDLSLTNGTAYFYKVFAKDAYGNYSSTGLTVGPATPTGPVTTVGNGTNPAGPYYLKPGDPIQSLDAFTLQTSTGTETVTGVTLTLSDYNGIGLISLTSADGLTTYGTLANPASVNPTVTLTTNITATTTLTSYLVRITPRSHVNMPAPPGGLYTISGTVTALVAGTNTKVYSDTGSTFIEIDNASTDVCTWGVITPGNTVIDLSWANPLDPDLDGTNSVVVLRKAGSAVTEVPVEGVVYSVGNTIGGATVRYVGPVEGFVDSPVTNFTNYYYAIFARDVNGNYSPAATTGPHQPWVPVCVHNTATLTISPATRSAIPTDVAKYTISVKNNDNALCAAEDFTLSLSDSNGTDFTIPSTLSATVLNIAPGATKQSTLTVAVKGTATLGNSNLTTINVAGIGGHTAPAPAAVTATTTAANPLMHNSKTTGSTKWGAAGWGITGGRYGTFNCYICHEESVVGANGTANVKKIRSTIVMPADAGAETWPNGSKTSPAITFADTRAGTSEYAETNGAHTTSTKVCEVCHTYQGGGEPNNSGVRYHAYNMTGSTVDEQNHNALGDCLGCHPHEGGFKAQGCTACHGYPINDAGDLAFAPATGSTTIGAHLKHETEAFDCDYCHGPGATASGGGAQHGTGRIAIDFYGGTVFPQLEASDGSYNGHTEVTLGYVGNDAGTVNGTRTCVNTYCHGGTIYPALADPTWTGTAACGSCHNDTSADAGWLGSHADHISASGANLDCNVCHGAGYAAGTLKPAGHLNGKVKIDLTTYGTYSKGANGSEHTTQGLTGATAYGTCTVSCHGTAATPNWGTDFGAYPAKCTKCHNDGDGGLTLLDAVPSASKGVHVKHADLANTQAANYVANQCDACHGTNAKNGTHANHYTDGAYPNGTATYANQLSGYSAANKNCTNTCHVATALSMWVTPTPPALACLDCHSSTYIGGNNATKGFNATPVSGLHNMTAAGVTKHDATLTDGVAGNGVGCGECHVTENTTTHMNGTFAADGDATANPDRWVTRANMTYAQIVPAGGNSGTCNGTGVGTGCHSDGGNWYRRWSTEANQADTVTAVGSAKCNVCHGQWGAWAQGTTHAAVTTRGFGHEPATPSCDVCHVYATGSARHDTATHQINVNSTGTTYARSNNTYGSGRGGCSQCHGGAGSSYDFPISYFALSPTPGTAPPMPACSSCHNDAAKAAAGVPQVIIAASGSSTHTDADGPGGTTYTINVAGFTAKCENCHVGHADGVSGANDVEIPVYYGTPVLGSAGAITIASTSTITRASGLNVFPVGSVINIYGATNAANNKNFTVTASAAGSLTVTPASLVAEAASTTISIASQVPTMGYGYGSHSRRIQLGGTAMNPATRTTEAQMCWDCHALRGISEWGANTKASTGNSPYNYGTLSTPDWTAATWSSSRTQYAYKSGAIQSTHTANPAVADAALTGAAYGYTETKNSNAEIRCTYCHDVHELGTAPGDKKEGSPYLRGSWMGNPYEEDGAPRSVYANTTYFTNFVFNTSDAGAAVTRTYGWGAVPRGSKNQAKLGGYWIDQNNVRPMTALTTGVGTAAKNPTATWEPLDTNAEAGNATATSPAFAGLCLTCHGTGATTALKIDGLDQKTGEALWMGTNGHANSVKGGTGSASANSTNVYTARTGVTTYGQVPRQHFAGMSDPGDNGNYGFRATEGLGYTPNLSSARGYGWTHDDWVVDDTGATKQNQYHKFSCSKCHNPHASRLPKLMITNCLDTVHNTWDNQFQLNGQTGNNLNKELAQWTSAQNCHRYSESNNTTTTVPEYRASRTAGPAGTGAGWNKVTPWKQTANVP